MDFSEKCETPRKSTPTTPGVSGSYAYEVEVAGARAAQRDAILRSKGYANSREFAKHCKRLAIRHWYSKRYGAWYRKQLGL